MQWSKAVTSLVTGGLAMSTGVLAVHAFQPETSDGEVRGILEERLPNTEITQLDCGFIDGLCELQTGGNVVYLDRSARFLIVGRVYDMETNQDLTAARLLEINPGSLVAGGARAKPTGEGEGASSSDLAKRVDLSGLPDNGAISYGRGRDTLTVFSDFRCGYCKKLFDELASMDVRVVERPISILGTRSLSDQVICAEDGENAVRAAYSGKPVSSAGDCDTSGLDANEAFAKKNGFTGTPVIVRSDGAVLQGYRDAKTIKRWLREGRGQ